MVQTLQDLHFRCLEGSKGSVIGELPSGMKKVASFYVSSKWSIYQETFNRFPGKNDSTFKKPTKDPPNHHQPSPPSQKASKSNLKSAQLVPPQKLRMHEMLVATPRPPMGWTTLTSERWVSVGFLGDDFMAGMVPWWFLSMFFPHRSHDHAWSMYLPPWSKATNENVTDSRGWESSETKTRKSGHQSDFPTVVPFTIAAHLTTWPWKPFFSPVVLCRKAHLPFWTAVITANLLQGPREDQEPHQI